MSYVAEPYSYVADQVLTGLTGGAARETHTFFAGANSFSFERDPATINVDTLQVTGQVNQAFFAFEQGRDYRVGFDGRLTFLANDKDKTQPAAQASWPDEGTEFYVGYYHADSAKALLTDRNVGSLVRTLAEAFARELSVLRKQLEMVYRSGFVDTAEGTALDMVVALEGVTRKRGEYAGGTVRFFRDTPAPADIFIPDGTRISTAVNPPVSFVTAVAKTLRRGQLAVEADIRAEVRGPTGIVLAKAITVVNQPILGINGVTNDAPTVLGGAGESDAELRARAKKVAERAGRATPVAVINALTEVGGLKENDIKLVEDLQFRPGVVQVFVARDPDAELAKDVEQAILTSRAAGIRVEHNLATLPAGATPAVAVAGGDLRDEGASPEPAPAADFKLPMLCDVLVFPDNPRITGADKTAMEQAATSAISDYIANSPIGGTLVYNQLVRDLMSIDGVADVVLSIGAKAGPNGPAKRNYQAPQGRRATLDPKDFTVRFAGAPVQFDFAIKVTSKGAALPDIEKSIKTALVDYFAANPASVNSADLMTKLGTSDQYELKPEDLTWTAEYDQAGLLIHDQGGPGAKTTINPGDRAVLRNVAVEVKA